MGVKNLAYLIVSTLWIAPNLTVIENNIAFKFIIWFLFPFDNVLSFILTYSCRVLIFMYTFGCFFQKGHT